VQQIPFEKLIERNAFLDSLNKLEELGVKCICQETKMRQREV
jgi:hypothetical protein